MRGSCRRYVGTLTRMVMLKLRVDLLPCESVAVHWIVFVVVAVTAAKVPLGGEHDGTTLPSTRSLAIAV